MYPAFRSTKSAVGFGLVVVTLLALPVIIKVMGLPSREQSFASLAPVAGTIGYQENLIYRDRENADILFVGSSLVDNDVLDKELEAGISKAAGKELKVRKLTINGVGFDQQYFLLRDYLQTHKPKLVVLQIAQPGLISNVPAALSFKWLRYGDYSEDLDGVSKTNKVRLYGEFVLGAPRQLLSKIRTNLLSEDELKRHVVSAKMIGYHGGPPPPSETLPSGVNPGVALYLYATSDLFKNIGPGISDYQAHFLKKTKALTDLKGVKLVLIHFPTDSEFGLDYIPSVDSWDKYLGPDCRIIAIPSKDLFPGVKLDNFRHFYKDWHMNLNGAKVLTKALEPAVLEAYGR